MKHMVSFRTESSMLKIGKLLDDTMFLSPRREMGNNSTESSGKHYAYIVNWGISDPWRCNWIILKKKL